MFPTDDTRMMMRKMRESHQEPLTPAMNLKTTPGLLTCINVCGILYFLVVTLVIVAVSFSVTLPALYSGLAFWSSIFVAVFILFQVCCMHHCCMKLRSASSQRLIVHWTWLRTAGDRAFGAAAPRLWNCLPADVVTSQSLATFKDWLKHFCSNSHTTDDHRLFHLP